MDPDYTLIHELGADAITTVEALDEGPSTTDDTDTDDDTSDEETGVDIDTTDINTTCGY